MSQTKGETTERSRRRKKADLRPVAVIVYAALIGLLLASYVEPLQQVFDGRTRIPQLEHKLEAGREHNEDQRRLIEGLQTREGIERAARERYGMIKPGEKVYIVGD